MSRMDRYNDQGWRCPNCGRVNRPETRFCSGCGSARQMVNDNAYGQYGAYGNDNSTYVAEVPRKSGGAFKVIAIVLVCLLVAGAAGFGIYKFIDSRRGGDDNYAENPPQETTEDSSETDTSDTDYDEEDNDESADEEPVDNSDSYYVVGNTYTIVAKEGVKVRCGPGRSYDQISRDSLSSEYKSQSLNGQLACLKKGAVVTCLGMDGNWMQISDGWICVEYEGETLVE